MSQISPNPPHDDQNASQWQDVYRACEGGLRAFLRGRLSQQVDVEDCLQAVCVKMLQRGQTVAPAARRAWLFRVAANEAAGLWRRKATTDRVLERQAEQSGEATDHDAADQVILSETTEATSSSVTGTARVLATSRPPADERKLDLSADCRPIRNPVGNSADTNAAGS